jgi:hypothetical protein
VQELIELGRAIEDGWRDADRDEERFADVAASALDASRFVTRFDRERFVDAVVDPHRPAGQQLAPVGTFGQPGLTAFHGDGFAIEVYYWLDSLPAIHNHPFCGVFTVLEGWSVHARYRTSAVVRAGARGQLVDTWLAGLEIVPTGAIERFSLRRHPLVHALVHIPVPSISMVIRTTRTEGYFRYLPPSIAIPMEGPEEPTARRLALLESLVASGDPLAPSRVRTFLERADFVTVVRLLGTLWPALDPGDRVTLLEAVAALHGDRTEAISASLDRALRIQHGAAVRAEHRDEDVRLCATALAYAESRPQVLGLLAARAGAPLDRLHAFADAVLDEGGEAATRAIAGILIDEGDAAAVVPALERRYGAEAVAEQRAEIERYCTESLFSVLASRSTSPPR